MSIDDDLAKLRQHQERLAEKLDATKARFVLEQDREILGADATSLSANALKDLRKVCLEDLALLDELRPQISNMIIDIDCELSNRQGGPKQEP